MYGMFLCVHVLCISTWMSEVPSITFHFFFFLFTQGVSLNLEFSKPGASLLPLWLRNHPKLHINVHICEGQPQRDSLHEPT